MKSIRTDPRNHAAEGDERKIRPPKATRWDELFRLTDDGEWIADDGRPGVAFYGRGNDEGGDNLVWPFAFSYGTARSYGRDEVQDAAMDACCDRYGCANGRRVDGRGRWA